MTDEYPDDEMDIHTWFGLTYVTCPSCAGVGIHHWQDNTVDGCSVARCDRCGHDIMPVKDQWQHVNERRHYDHQPTPAPCPMCFKATDGGEAVRLLLARRGTGRVLSEVAALPSDQVTP